MKQQYVIDVPPNHMNIQRAFGLRVNAPVLFSYGNTVYNPMDIDVPPQLIAHELVHGERQASYPEGVEAWWDRYIKSAQFRLQEEIPAHMAEYRTLAETGNRNERRAALKMVAGRLAAPLYGSMISKKRAMELLR